MKPIRTCPICGSKKVARVCEAVQFRSPAGLVSVPDVAFDRCGNCSESFFDTIASEKIDAVVTAAKRHRPRRKSA